MLLRPIQSHFDAFTRIRVVDALATTEYYLFSGRSLRWPFLKLWLRTHHTLCSHTVGSPHLLARHTGDVQGRHLPHQFSRHPLRQGHRRSLAHLVFPVSRELSPACPFQQGCAWTTPSSTANYHWSPRRGNQGTVPSRGCGCNARRELEPPCTSSSPWLTSVGSSISSNVRRRTPLLLRGSLTAKWAGRDRLQPSRRRCVGNRLAIRRARWHDACYAADARVTVATGVITVSLRWRSG